MTVPSAFVIPDDSAPLRRAVAWVQRTTRSHQELRKLRKLHRVPQVRGSGRLARRRPAPSGSTTSSRLAAWRHCCLSGLSTATFNQLHAHCVHTMCIAAVARRRARDNRGNSWRESPQEAACRLVCVRRFEYRGHKHEPWVQPHKDDPWVRLPLHAGRPNPRPCAPHRPPCALRRFV